MSCFCLLPSQFPSVYNVLGQQSRGHPSCSAGAPGHTSTLVSLHRDGVPKTSWWNAAHVALSPANCYLGKIFLCSHVFSLSFLLKKNWELQYKSRAGTSKTAALALYYGMQWWHAACEGSKWVTLAVFQGSLRHGILDPASQRWSPGSAHLDSQPGWRDINLAAWSSTYGNSWKASSLGKQNLLDKLWF